MLDVRLKALDFMMQRGFPEEMLMAKRELNPRRFERSQKMQSRWRAAEEVLVLQEMLVRLKSARHRRERERVSVWIPVSPRCRCCVCVGGVGGVGGWGVCDRHRQRWSG